MNPLSPSRRRARGVSAPRLANFSFKRSAKAQGTCKPGERADLTHCTPATGGAQQQDVGDGQTESNPVDNQTVEQPNSEAESINWSVALGPGAEEAATKQAEKVVKENVLGKLGEAGKWLKDKTAQVYTMLEHRYGKKTAIAIFVGGHVLGLATPLAVIPGSTLVGMAPFAAMAEVYLQASNALHQKALAEQMTPQQIGELSKKLVAKIQALWKLQTDKYENEAAEQLQELEDWFDGGEQKGLEALEELKSWFDECPRDEAGHCLPKGEGDRTGQGDDEKPKDKPTEEDKPDEKPKTDPAEYKVKGTKSAVFKSWFGDWETDPKDASKVVNEKGEPKETIPLPAHGNANSKPRAVYHGAIHGGFRKFDKGHLTKTSLYGMGFYFTESDDIAEAYAEHGFLKPGEEQLEKPKDAEVFEVFLNIRNPYNADSLIDSEVAEKMVQEFVEMHGKPDKGNADQFKLSLYGRQYAADSELPEPEMGKVYLGQVLAAINKHYVDAAGQVTQYLQSKKFDGVVRKDNWVPGKGAVKDIDARTWVAFEPNQIKAKANGGLFSADDDIYKSLPGMQTKMIVDPWIRLYKQHEVDMAKEVAQISGSGKISGDRVIFDTSEGAQAFQRVARDAERYHRSIGKRARADASAWLADQAWEIAQGLMQQGKSFEILSGGVNE